MIDISMNDSLYSIITKHPEIKSIMVSLGFKDITKTGMLQSVGRIMTIKKGCLMKKIDISDVKELFSKNNYNLLEE